MEFRLVYRGKLRADSGGESRAREKHAIRRYLHPQLKELWVQHSWFGDPLSIAANFSRCGFRFIPLVRRDFGLACALDILFLRRDAPGNVIRSGGDLDNRVKTLFDGLRAPLQCSELAGAVPESGEDPFFCLLEDDSLITDVRITTDRLLSPSADKSDIHDVELVIRVESKFDLPTIEEVEELRRRVIEARREVKEFRDWPNKLD